MLSNNAHVEVYRKCSVGKLPSCATPKRLEDRHSRRVIRRTEKLRRQEKPDDFITYDDSDNESDDEQALALQTLKVSYSFVDYVSSREMGLKEVRKISKDYCTRHILTNDMFKESPINLGNMNKVFCSEWLTDKQIVFGTKCNKLMVYDVASKKLDQIPSLLGHQREYIVEQCGIHAVSVNPSRTLLATGAKFPTDIAFYSLPTLDPICVGENAHSDWIFDSCWIDDEFLVSGSRDSSMALWRIHENLLPSTSIVKSRKRERPLDLKFKKSQKEVHDDEDEDVQVLTYKIISPVSVKDCRNAQKVNAQKVRALVYNKQRTEIAALSLNGYIHIWDATMFRQRISRKLPSCQENVCIAVQDNGNGLYAIGCRSYTLLLDSRTLQAVKKVSTRYSGCGVRSASFQNNILTIGTGVGVIMFYDVRIGKYLESSINSSRTVLLKTSKGNVFPEEFFEDFPNVKYTPAVYTHSFDPSGTRLFTAGGPLPSSIEGNYAGLWQ